MNLFGFGSFHFPSSAGWPCPTYLHLLSSMRPYGTTDVKQSPNPNPRPYILRQPKSVYMQLSSLQTIIVNASHLVAGYQHSDNEPLRFWQFPSPIVCW